MGGATYVSTVSLEATKVQIVDGWYDFVVGNCLCEGDSLMFCLKEDAKSEFEVYVFQKL